MAKDGTNRGGRRVRAGTKPDALTDKIADKRSAKVLEPLDFDIDDSFEADDLMDMCDLDDENIPKPSEYLSAEQKDGTHLKADEIFKETWLWLKKRKCESFVNPRLVEAYSQAFARYVQCEEAISKFGFLGKHPTTGVRR